MRKYLYTTLLLALLAQEGVMAQENEGKKGGFFGKIKDTFSTEIKIGNYTFKDGSVYTGEMKGRKPNGKYSGCDSEARGHASRVQAILLPQPPE